MEKKIKESKEKEAESNEPINLENTEKEITNDNLHEDDSSVANINETEDNENTEKNFEEELELLRDEKLRLLAEMENVRKRADRERTDLIKYGGMNFARDVLSLDDNLSRALDSISEEHINSEKIRNLLDGLKMVQKEFSTILEKNGIKKIEAINKKFDHNFHQAMVEIENNDAAEGTVIQEMQTGYTMHDKLLRPSMVGVAKKDTKKNK